MLDQIKIGDKASYDDFSASLAERKIQKPKKKSIKETVPFSNVTYDFSCINGEPYWEEAELSYTFEMTADTPEKLEDLKRAFSNWMMNIQEEEIHDPFIPDYHYKGTFENIEFADDEGLDKTTATVTFKAYPYMIANYAKAYELIIPASTTETLRVLNESSHPVSPTITLDCSVVMAIGTSSFGLPEGTITDERVKLPRGLTEIAVQNTNASACTLRISFYEEVF